ncbi:hypothetical protein Goari_011670 [Gossypium aridum]|uniref:Uncharacterized protein n=1 Tax=Gossypium aridum TaxID=34290 RepID=A0A7J8WZG7_GOSAI|nr:hypothetical protein [Gossypium aridum]
MSLDEICSPTSGALILKGFAFIPIGWAIFEELSIPCKMVLNVVRMEETEALAILKSILCVSGFDYSSIFNHLNVILVLPISKECLGGILGGLSNVNSIMSS